MVYRMSVPTTPTVADAEQVYGGGAKRTATVANLIFGHQLTPRLHKVPPGATLILWLQLPQRA